MDGIDENHCEELEFNECEENEYRCEDGSCIPEQYWLDGVYDCSDKSDEQNLEKYSPSVFRCPVLSYQFNCDEATQHPTYFACGDGEFHRDDMIYSLQCYNYRNIMFVCESLSHRSEYDIVTLWTLENGHCVDKSRIEKSLADMDESEQCLFYLKCKLTSGKTIGCDEVLEQFYSLCESKRIIYPKEPVLRPYFQIIYYLPQVNVDDERYNMPTDYLFNGSIKCIGYRGRSDSQVTALTGDYFDLFDGAFTDYYFCRQAEEKLVFGPQTDKNCWNDTKQSFLCQNYLRCISKHRVRNGLLDCGNLVSEDEHDSQTCYAKSKHRYHCSEESSLCLPVFRIGDTSQNCKANDDEYVKQLKWVLNDYQCTEFNSNECDIIRTYIQSPSLLWSITNNTVLLFRQYCDTVWHLSRGFDESDCTQWKCPKDQYQCLTGHCVPVIKTTGSRRENFDWNCPDASDGIALFRITKLSEHNAQLISESDLEKIKEEVLADYADASTDLFNKLCNKTIEYNCILANVNNPINFTINRPCINLTQISDGIIDCYGGLDERNLLTCGNNIDEQRGFDFHCSDQECIPYHRICEQRCSNKADSVLCDQLPTLWKPGCTYPTKHTDICNYIDFSECDIFTNKLYYCDIQRTGK